MVLRSVAAIGSSVRMRPKEPLAERHTEFAQDLALRV